MLSLKRFELKVAFRRMERFEFSVKGKSVNVLLFKLALFSFIDIK